MKKITISAFFLLFISLFFVLATPVEATPQKPQAYYFTPTPGLDGRILYTVKKNDTCLSVSLMTGVDVTQLRDLNKLDDACTLVEGQQILLGTFQTPTPTPGPSPTPTPIMPTPTPFNGSGKLCIYLYEDVNGTGMPETTEAAIAGGAVSITDQKNTNTFTGITVDTGDPLCFDNLPEGDYNISVAPPQGYNATTNMNYPLFLQAGSQSNVDFGAQLSAKSAPPPTPEEGKSPVFALVGGLLVLAGIGLGIYFLILQRK